MKTRATHADVAGARYLALQRLARAQLRPNGQLVQALRTVAGHRRVVLQSLGVALDGMPRVAQSRWATWRKRQRSNRAVPQDFGVLLETLDGKTRAWMAEAAA